MNIDELLKEIAKHRHIFSRQEWVPFGAIEVLFERAALGARDPAPPAWQPIETAPKDGTNVLLWWPFWCKNRPTIGWFGYKGIQQWVAPEALEGDGDPPTHWMPLPAAPASGREDTANEHDR